MSRQNNIDQFNYILETSPIYRGYVEEYTENIVKYGIKERKNTYSPKIIVTKNDCLDDARNATASSSKSNTIERVMLINSASRLRRGGGVTTGASAQEEHICRNSNLYLALGETKYPIDTRTIKGIYYSDVELLDKFSGTTVDVVSLFSCPINHLPENTNTFMYHFEIFKCLWKIIQDVKPKSVILVPIGCGVFGHKAQFVRNALAKVIEMYETPEETKEIIISCFTDAINYRDFSKIAN